MSANDIKIYLFGSKFNQTTYGPYISVHFMGNIVK